MKISAITSPENNKTNSIAVVGAQSSAGNSRVLVSPLISSMKKSMNSYDEESKKSSENPQHEYFII